MKGRRLPVRWRLTIVYGGLFFLGTAVLMTINYLMVDQILRQRFSILVKLPSLTGPVGGGHLPQPPSGAPVRTLIRDAVTSEVGTYVDAVSNSLLRWSFLATALVGVAGLALGWSVAGRALAPLLTVTDTARRLLTYAFAADVTRRIKVAPVRERVEHYMARQHGLPTDFRIQDLAGATEDVVF